METAVDAIITIDTAGCVASFNNAAEKMFGWNRDEVIGGNVSRLMPSPHREAHDDYIMRYMSTGSARIIGIGRNLHARRKDGTLIPIHLTVSEFEIDGERNFTGIIRDLTDLQRADQEIRKQSERLAHAGRLSLMGEMTAAIAHEINQPLTAISLYAEAATRLIEQSSPDFEKINRAISKMGDQSLRAGAVIERIQRFVRGQDGHREDVLLNDLIEEVVSLATNDARLHDITIETEYDTSLGSIRCDPIEIQQVGLNLIRNAIDAMTEIGSQNGRLITVRTSAVSNGVRVEVVDAGTGVSDDHRDDLFTAFKTSKPNGMGMGLSICKSIIEAHGGRLDFSNNVGHGATFFFELPKEYASG